MSNLHPAPLARFSAIHPLILPPSAPPCLYYSTLPSSLFVSQLLVTHEFPMSFTNTTAVLRGRPIVPINTRLTPPWPYAKSQLVVREQIISQNKAPPSPRDYSKTMPDSSNPASPSDLLNHEASIPASGRISNSAESDGGGEGGGDGRKGYGKRELSTSKRAAQNRAAQVGSTPRGFAKGGFPRANRVVRVASVPAEKRGIH